MCHALVCLISLRLSTLYSSFVSPIFYFFILIFHFIFYVDRFGDKPLVRFREWGVWPFGQQRPSHRLWAQLLRRLQLLRPLKFSSRSLPATPGPRTCVSEISDDTIGRALSSPLFTQEREEPAGRRQAYHSHEESLLSSQSLSVGHVRTGRLVNEFGSLSSSARQNPCRDSEKWANQDSSGTTKRANSPWL